MIETRRRLGAGHGASHGGATTVAVVDIVVLCLSVVAVAVAAWWSGALPWTDPQGGVEAAAAHQPDAVGTVLHLSFEERQDTSSGVVRYVDSRGRWQGTVVGALGGSVRPADGPPEDGVAAQFPSRCEDAKACPRALIEIADHGLLDPGLSDFEYGATILLEPDETAKGSNVVQKGRFSTPGGQWKLQVDTLDGRPSCVVRGELDGRSTLGKVTSETAIADGEWHDVKCRKTQHTLTIRVDGATWSDDVTLGLVTNEQPVRIGASGVSDDDDQFHGRVDNVLLVVGTP